MRIKHLILLICCLPAIAFSVTSQNWQAVIAKDPVSKQNTCLLISSTKHTEDGQTSTPVKLSYNGEIFIAITNSNIDLSYADVGLQVDDHSRHTIDRLFKNTSAIFETDAELIRDEFKRGLNAKLILGFWPTWPVNKSYALEFDLRGFTKAYNEFLQCEMSGNIP